MTPSASLSSAAAPATRHPEPTTENIRELVYAFYDRVRADPLLGPVFDTALAGRWDTHLPKMGTFWASLVLGEKGYRGNVQQAHEPLPGVERSTSASGSTCFSIPWKRATNRLPRSASWSPRCVSHKASS